MIEGIDYYEENGYKVFTKTYLQKVRKQCCTNRCRHCPWEYGYRMKLEQDTIYIDQDGVLADFERGAIEHLGDSLLPIGHPGRHDQISDCQHIPGFYRKLHPIPGAIEAFHLLREHYEVYILTAHSWDSPMSMVEKQEWLIEHLGEEHVYKRIMFSHAKNKMIGRALIDDRGKYGSDKFIGEWIHYGSPKYSSWNPILKKLVPNYN